MNKFLTRGLQDGYKVLLFELARHRKEVLNFIPIKPKSAIINVTLNCNARCITCNAWKNKSVNELSLSEIENVLTQLKDIGIKAVGFGGGEPLIREDLPQIVEKAHNLGFEGIDVVTNGLLSVENLIEKGLTSVTISINGMGETHDLTRGIKGAYEKTTSNLWELVALRDFKYPTFGISISTILMQPTVNEIIPLIRIARFLGIGFGFGLIEDSLPIHKGVDKESLWVREGLDDLIKKLHRLKRNSSLKCSHTKLEYTKKYFNKQDDMPCYLGYLVVYVNSHGEVYPGCFPLGSVGNLREKSLKEILESQEYKNGARAMFRKECPGCPCNTDVNLWYSLPMLIREGLWRIGI